MVDAWSKSLTDEQVAAINEFVRRVNIAAESNIEKTNRLEGSHYAAMTALLAKINHPHGLLLSGWQGER